MDAIVQEKVRPRLFERTTAPKGMQLTARDLTLLAHVCRHRFLTSGQMARLDGGSQQGVLRCLRALFDHGYLDRPKQQLATMLISGPRPFVYGLGKKGAHVLREMGPLVDGSVDWTEKNKRSGAVFIEHTLAIADFMIGLELACRTRGDTALVHKGEILSLAPEETRAAREPLRWKVDKVVMGKREVYSVVPDGLFGLAFPDETAAYFLLEVDRGTIPIMRDGRRTNAWHKSIAYKLATYWEGWKAGQHEKQFGVSQMRVALVTSSRERVVHMLEVVREMTGGKGTGFFVFIDRDTLAAGDPLQAKWVNGRGEMVRLGD